VGEISIDILYVITDLELGGVPLHLQRLVRAMRARGLEAAVVSLVPAGPVGKMLEADGVTVYSCEGRGGWDFRVIARLAKIIQAIQPGLVHSLLFHANLATRWAATTVGYSTSRVLCEIQTVEVERRWHLWVDRVTYDGCRFTIGNSPSVIEHLAVHARIPRDRLRLVRGGIDPAPIQAAKPIDRSSIGMPHDSAMVLWVGRLDPVKGLSILIESFRLIHEEANAHLCLAGVGTIREQLERQVRGLQLVHCVHFLGPRTDVAALLQAADVFVFPSRTEGLPNALLEAMAAACPIVTTDVPGCRDLIMNGQTGLIVPYGDTPSLAAAMRRLLRDRAFAARLGAKASEVARTEWNIRQTYEAYAALYDEARDA
jgi:glycosyltransferase involved in cell wall biosynthesis